MDKKMLKAVNTRCEKLTEIVSLLEELQEDGEKINVNYKDPSDHNRTYLIKAAIMGDLPLVDPLLRYGADVNARDSGPSRRTALIWAACEGEFEVVKLLIHHKADLNAQDESGLTALMEASMRDVKTRKHYECVDILLTSGADPNLKSEAGKKALEYAEGTGATGALTRNLTSVGPSESLSPRAAARLRPVTSQ